MIDIVFPQKNEKEFIEIAERLGFKALLMVYADKKDFPKIKSEKLELFFGTLLPKKSGFVIAKSTGNDRDVLEGGKADLIFDLELWAEKDTMHQRVSGLNQIMCKPNKKTIIGLDFNAVLDSS
jgi:hypothetical protein